MLTRVLLAVSFLILLSRATLSLVTSSSWSTSCSDSSLALERMNVLVYAGNGTSVISLSHTIATLRKLLSHRYDIKQVNASMLASQPWDAQCALIVVPGGRDVPYTRDLEGAANKRIRRYVDGGGQYLGICAGGYYGSHRVEFERGTELEVCGSRELGFFPGTCRGATFPGFVYNSELGALATRVRLSSELWKAALEDKDAEVRLAEVVDLYYNGGGVFVHAQRTPRTRVLATYAQLAEDLDPAEEESAAIVECQVGDSGGKAILTGVHPEYIAGDMDISDPAYTGKGYHGENLVNTLLASDSDREVLMSKLLARLKLEPSCVDQNLHPTPMFLAALAPEDLIPSLAAWSCQFGSGTKLIDTAHDFYIQVSPNEVMLAPMHISTPHPLRPTKYLNIISKYNEALSKVTAPFFSHDVFWKYLVESRNRLSASAVFSRWKFGTSICWTHAIESTQTLLEKNSKFSENLPNGFVLMADLQISGRGRGGNSWISPPGCLQFSILFRQPVDTIHRLVFIQYIAALAVVEAVRARPGYEDIPLFLKWPNDIYAKLPDEGSTDGTDRLVKIGGVLVNSNISNNEYTLIVGCGVNLNNTSPTTSINALIAAYNDQHKRRLPPIREEDMLATVLSTLEAFHERLLRDGFSGKQSSLMDLYLRRWLHSGQHVYLQDRTTPIKAIVQGITPNFGLLDCVDAEEKLQHYELQPDGNSFDLMKGLIVAKRSVR